jgi:myo-inositol-1(or 4)-monophosphatase
MLNVAVRAVRAAGSIINRAALDVEAVRVAQKQSNDFVTEVDQASEAAIIEALLTAYPGHGILAEESGRVHGHAGSDHIWIIDPLDGTTNFIHGFPVYCVSVALQVAGRIEQAVVYDPTRNDLFTATRGRGAFLNDRRIRVSKRVQLSDCLIATGFPYRPGDDVPTYLKMMGKMMRATAGLRRPGSAALDLAYVAAGFSDGFFETGLKPWDVAAGALLVTEAGGLIGNFAGDALQLDVPECLAANPKVYAQMVKLLAAYSRPVQPPSPQPESLELTASDQDAEPPAPETLSPSTPTDIEAPAVSDSPAEVEAEAGATPATEESAPPSPAAANADDLPPEPRPRLRAAPRRAPEPEDEPAPRYRRTPAPGPRDPDARPPRYGRPGQDADRERPYRQSAARPAGRFGDGQGDSRPGFGKRPGQRPYPSDGRPPERASRYRDGPRREDDAPRGKPAFGARPAPSRAAPYDRDRPPGRTDRPRASPRRDGDAPRGKPYTPRAR